MKKIQNYVIIGLFLLILISSHAQTLDKKALVKMNPPLRSLLRRNKQLLARLASNPDKNVALISKNGEIFIKGFLVTDLSEKELLSLGVKAHKCSGDIYTAEIPYRDIPRLAQNTRIKKIEISLKCEPELDMSVPNTKDGVNFLGIDAENVWLLTTGSDALVGVVDSGVDWTHEDFFYEPVSGGNTRIVRYWDQNIVPLAGEHSPTAYGFNYGVEWDNTDIDGGTCRSADTDGHGTHVAGTAAGNGWASDGDPPPPKYTGVAPSANLIAVGTSYYDDDIVDGVNYAFKVADELGKPAVINLSLGHNFGPHDGTYTSEQALDSLTGPGKIIVKSAGNNTGKAIHAEDIVPPSGSSITTFDVPSASIDTIWIDIWVDAGDSYEVFVKTPGASTAGPQAPGGANSWLFPGEGNIYLENYNSTPHPEGDQEIFIEISNVGVGTISPGSWSLTLERLDSGGDGAFDAWIAVPSAGIVQFTSNNTETETISTPGTARQVITVGAYTTKVSWEASNGSTYGASYDLGDITPFSSRGPSRDTPSDPGYLKPELTAPGAMIASALSQDYFPPASQIADDSRHYLSGGTSMAAPHVTGTIALLLSMEPSLTPEAIKTILCETARTDTLTPPTPPDNTWGYGKLDAYSAANQFTPARRWELYE